MQYALEKRYVTAAKVNPSIPPMPVGSLAEAFQRYRGDSRMDFKGVRNPRGMGAGLRIISGVSSATYARAPSHWNISACSARWSSRKFRAERHTASSRFGAHYGGSAPPWDIAGRMKIHRRVCGIYSLSRAKCSGPTRRLFCSSRPHGEPGIADLPPPLPLRGILRYRRLTCASSPRHSGSRTPRAMSLKLRGLRQAAPPSRRSLAAPSRVIDAYLASLGAEIAPTAPIFRNRSGTPYSKNALGDDFRVIAYGSSVPKKPHTGRLPALRHDRGQTGRCDRRDDWRQTRKRLRLIGEFAKNLCAG